MGDPNENAAYQNLMGSINQIHQLLAPPPPKKRWTRVRSRLVQRCYPRL